VTRKPTKTWRTAQARAIIDRNVIGVEFTPMDVAEMNAVLETQCDGFVRRKNPRYPTDPRHLYALTGGMWDSLSWKKAISPIDPLTEANKVCRASIAPDMAEFISSQDDQSCRACGVTDDLTTDHTPAFDDIFTAYIDAHGVPEVIDSPDGVGKMFKDIDAEAAWIAFHQSRVVYLQILCRPCNASKGKRGSSWLGRPSKQQEEPCA
jgi:hypothetical protein